MTQQNQQPDPQRISLAALTRAIPRQHLIVLHSMYEDSDLDGEHEARILFSKIEQEAPGTFVLFQCNDSVAPRCEHSSCDF
jgi:hypothetical protein